MAKQTTSMKKARTRYSQTSKDGALALADRIDTRRAAQELNLQPGQL